MAGWGCPHEVNEYCQRLKRPCRPGRRGCILYGKVTLRDEEAPASGETPGGSALPARAEPFDCALRLLKEGELCRSPQSGQGERPETPARGEPFGFAQDRPVEP